MTMRTLEKDELITCVLNSVQVIEDEEGYLSFLRFTDKQMAVYEPNALYRPMSQCSSGICLSLETNADELTFECRTAELNPKVLVEIKGEMTFGQVFQLLTDTVKKVNQAGSKLDIIQFFDLYVDGAYQSAVRLGSGNLTFTIPNPDHQWVHVKIYFPLYKPLCIRNVSINGEWRPASEKRPVLYAFGDSITQGFISGRPSFCYVAQLAELLGVDAVNQGIGGAMYDPHILDDYENLATPDLITIAYGTNDWRNNPDFDDITARVTGFYERLSQLYPDVPTYVLTPIWRDDLADTMPSGTFSGVIELIRQTADAYPQIRLIDGLAVSPHNPTCFADGFLHPNIMGFSYMAPRLYKAMQDWNDAPT
jgi:lysophospholipase L1-like esterase